MKNIKKNKNIRLAGDFPESPVFDPVTELQNADKVLAFENVTDYGASNVPLSQLVNRDAFLNAKIDALPATQQEVNERLVSNKYVSPATLPVVAQVLVGCFMYYSFPKSNLTGTGWYACDGSLYPIASPVGQVLNNLSTDYKNAWNIEIVSTSIRIHDIITSQAWNEGGYFFRAMADGMQGTNQKDAMRNTKGSFKISDLFTSSPVNALGSFLKTLLIRSPGGVSPGGASASEIDVTFSAQDSAVIDKEGAILQSGTLYDNGYIAGENRPISIGALPIIYLGV